MNRKKSQEDKNIQYIEKRYCYEQRQSLYIANEEINQVWDESDIPDFIQAWENNWSLNEIAEYLGADQFEIQLLATDLIKRGKIQGNVHIFKPKRKAVKPMETFTMGDHVIRSTYTGDEHWVCIKDLWNWIKKAEHSYRKITEDWGPEQRAKFVIQTDGGPQKMIFINARGLDRLSDKLDPWQKNQVGRLRIRVLEATEKVHRRKKNAKKRRKSG